MDILVITWNFPPRRGGIEYLMSNLCAGLEKKHSVFVITAYASALITAEENVFRAPWPGLAMFFPYVLWRGARLLWRQRGVKVIFGGSVLVTPLVLLLARVFKRKAGMQAHGLDLIYPHLLYQFFCVRWLKFCDRIVVNSSFTASLARQKGVRQETISVIPPGVNAENFVPPSVPGTIKEKRKLSDARVVLFVGRLTKRKGIKEFIQHSLPCIVEAVPNACFVVVGDNARESLAHHDDALTEITVAIEAVGLRSHVRMLGAVEDDELIGLYHACDLVILPGLPLPEDVEGFGIVLLEAAAAGKPVVATRVGGISDAVEQGKSGILVDPGDYLELSRSVVSLLTDEGKKNIMGEFARRRAQEKFQWEFIVARYEEVLLYDDTLQAMHIHPLDSDN